MSKQILILGAGESGVGAAKLALARGYAPFVSDAGPGKAHFVAELENLEVSYEVGGHNPSLWGDISEGYTVIKSPGIPDTVKVVEDLKGKGAEIISEIEFASRFATGKVIAVTGANGKTTTTSLIHSIFSDAGLKSACVGNIGTSWCLSLIHI